MNRLLRDCIGASLVEFTIVFPVLALAAFGTVDAGFLLFDYARANKATYVGAHTAILSYPVATEITNLMPPTCTTGCYDVTKLGNLCYRADGTASGDCPPISTTTCTSTACSPSTYGFSSAAFTKIFTPMQAVFPSLQPTDVTITYQRIDNSGFVGRPGGLPLGVTVRITGATHRFWFIGPLMRFFGGNFAATTQIPAFATTLVSEDLITN